MIANRKKNTLRLLLIISVCLLNFSIIPVFSQSLGLDSASKLPNVIVILADDIGQGDIAAYRQKYSKGKIIVQTPNLDQLLESGIHFTDAHSPAALCAPSRYSIMTGNYTHRSYAPWGVWSAYAKSPLKNQLTLAQLMKNAGYQTGFFGKWHMGGGFAQKGKPDELFIPKKGKNQFNTEVDIRKYIVDGPIHVGFDYSYTFPAGIQAEPYAAYENEFWLPYQKDSKIIFINQENVPKGVKLDKRPGLGDSNWDPHNAGPLLIHKAVDYIHKQSNKTQPFFMYYASQAVHKPHTPPKTLHEIEIAGSYSVKHLDMIKELDVQIGMMLDALKKNGVYENTLIIFTSDNGGLGHQATLATKHDPSNGYRGSKNQIYEGGHRVPFIASWKDKIKAATASSESIIAFDIMAALAALTDQKLEDKDSFNILPLLLGKKKAKGRDIFLIQGGTGKEVACRKGNMKLIIQLHYKDQSIRTPIALFDLGDNPSELESKNLIDQTAYKKVMEEMFDEFIKLRFD